MAYRKRTLRMMPEETWKLARLIGKLTSTTTRLKNLVPEVERLELDSKALTHAKQIKYLPESLCPDCWIDYTGSGLINCLECGVKLITRKPKASPFPPDQPEG